MKTISLYSLFIAILFSCTNKENESQTVTKIKIDEVLPLRDTTANGVVTEYYPGSKIKKLAGRLDANGKRHETWYYFKKDGTTGTVTTYFHGKKHGHTIVYHPNGALNYKGEYTMDEKTGAWKFYDKQGNLVKEEVY